MNIFNSLGSNYNLGYVVRSFSLEKDIKKLETFLEKKYSGKATLTHKGRQAIELALKASLLEPKSGVAVTGFTCIAVIEAIEKAGYTPVYIDIDPKTLNFTAEALEGKLEKNNIKVAMIQNTLGYPCDIESISRLCKKNKLILIEDLAHSIGAVYSNGKEAGTVGDFVILSFSQDKVIDAVSGGALIVRSSRFKVHNSEKSANTPARDKLYPLLTWIVRKTYPVGLGKVLHFAFRTLHLLSDPMKNSANVGISDWSAGIALYEFKKIENNLTHRRNVAKIYSENLDPKIISSKINSIIKNSTCLRFPVFVENRDNFIKKLEESGVHASDIWYDSPIAPKKYLGLARYPKSSCPNAEKVAEKIMNLPTHTNISEKEAIKISELINLWLKSQ